MTASSCKGYGSKARPLDLTALWNWPRRVPKEPFWRELAERVRGYPTGVQAPWGVPFRMAAESGPRVILLAKGRRPVTVRLTGRATHLCVLHEWRQRPETVRRDTPDEGRTVAEYVLTYADGTSRVLPVRARFHVPMVESPGPPWLAVGFRMPEATDPTASPGEVKWGHLQTGVKRSAHDAGPAPYLCVFANPHPERSLRALVLRGLEESPLLVAGLTLYSGADTPIRHLPRRTYRLHVPGKPARVAETEVDFGTVTRIERSAGPRGKRWLTSPYLPTIAPEPAPGAEDLVEVVAARDATLSVRLEGRKRPLRFSVGQAFHEGRSGAGNVRLEVLGRERQWVQVTVVDAETGQPTPVRLHMSGARGEYLPPYGHHAQINANWFEDYGADLLFAGRNYAYVPGRFTTDLPVGDLYVEMHKGFEYAPVRKKVTLRRGQKELKLSIRRWKDLRSAGWVTADTHVHFLSPQTAWLEAQAEGVNVVNLLASQWGRLFTNVGDLTGKPGVVENDTIVFVGTENRNHMLGHMSMLGTKGLPVFPMCCGGVSEAWIGDPDLLAMAEWARENRRKGGVVIRPHFPYCGFTEDPVPIVKGLVDALEINPIRDGGFPVQEWYRYLNCGYRVAVCGGTDKMGAYTALGWMRTYALLDPNRPFTYANWARAVRAGRTFTTNGPLMTFEVEGRGIGDTLRLPPGGGTVEVAATAEAAVPLGRLEIVVNGRVAASTASPRGARRLALREKVRLGRSGWIAARCRGRQRHPGGYAAAHTSPVYVECGRERPFDGPAAQHMLTLVEGGIEYLNNLATVFDESSRRRMVKLFDEVRHELKGRLLVEGGHSHSHGGNHRH